MNRIAGLFKLKIAKLSRLHSDESGAIGLASVFFVIFFSMVLGMLMNVSRHANRKVLMQNGADAASYSGGVVLARSMNTLTFTNHLLFDVFALTAYLREARDRQSEGFAANALTVWEQTAPRFRGAPVTKFSNLEWAIPQHAQLERNLISVFGQENAVVSDELLPVLEFILANELIPEFQRALHAATPGLANQAANEIANRHGPVTAGLAGQQPLMGHMWRTDAEPFDGATEQVLSTLPVADPIFDTTEFQPMYFVNGLQQREQWSFWYLALLNNTMFRDFDEVAKMSQFANFWRGFSRGYLEQLLDEYPDRNIPYQIRESANRTFDQNQYLHDEYQFVGVVYWDPVSERLPGLFSNPLDADDLAFSQVRLFIARNRLLYNPLLPPQRRVFRQSNPQIRDLINQHWTVQLTPATSPSIPSILQTSPPNFTVDVPNLGGISVEEFQRINTH